MTSQTSYDELFEQALNTVQNRFLLSVLLAKRVAQLRKGSEPLVNAQGMDTFEKVVFLEIIEGKLEWRTIAAQPQLGDMNQDYLEGDFDDQE